jgi:hypothetical protein
MFAKTQILEIFFSKINKGSFVLKKLPLYLESIF